MSRTVAIVASLLALLISSVPAFANSGSLLAGTCTIDVSKLSMSDPPTSVTIVFLVMGGGFKHHPANTRVFSLSDDGKHMIETVVSHASDGTPHTRVDIWSRAK